VFGLLSRSGLPRDMPNQLAPQSLPPVARDLHGGPRDQQQMPDAAQERARGLRAVHLTPHTTLIGLPGQRHRSIEQRRQVVRQHLRKPSS
jgi:hypothetical protein